MTESRPRSAAVTSIATNAERGAWAKRWCRIFHRQYWYPVDSNSVACVTIYRCGQCDESHSVSHR